MIGRIIKGIGGFYYVKTTDGIIQTRGRGIFKKDNITLTVGDIVEIEVLSDGNGVIDKLFPRKNHFIRPPISNVDCIVVTFAAKNPKPNFDLIDKFLIMAESKGVKPVLCMNKADLISEKLALDFVKPYKDIYDVVMVSAENKRGTGGLFNLIEGKCTAFAGPSGVGKSTIINALLPYAYAETSEISRKTKRGKHTTRHVEMFETPKGGFIYDTPGFTSFDLSEIDEEDLSKFYPEIKTLSLESGGCRFDNCSHIHEPGCRVLLGLREGRIDPKRYESYKKNYKELLERKKW
ncbi:ribosome small subunit-dependent GTPase A [Eubacterium nodatum ATCC 33099]|nr:ribosome small subunit-dependent GTPase A [Eubacterium nodatum ATCC 33099]